MNPMDRSSEACDNTSVVRPEDRSFLSIFFVIGSDRCRGQQPGHIVWYSPERVLSLASLFV